MSEHAGSVRSFVRLRQEKILFTVPKIIRHGVFLVECMHALADDLIGFVFVAVVYPALGRDLFPHFLYHLGTAIKAPVKTM